MWCNLASSFLDYPTSYFQFSLLVEIHFKNRIFFLNSRWKKLKHCKMLRYINFSIKPQTKFIILIIRIIIILSLLSLILILIFWLIDARKCSTQILEKKSLLTKYRYLLSNKINGRAREFFYETSTII